jgi:hypothetical protein
MATLIKILDNAKFLSKTVFNESTPSEGSSLTNGLQAFYKLDDTSDSSGNNRTLANNGNVTFASGKLGNAAVFDGSNYLVTDQSSELSLNEISFSAWVYPVSNSDNLVILCQNFDDSSPWFLHPYEGELRVTGGGGGTYVFGFDDPNNTSIVPLNQWSHVATTYVTATKTWKCFVNGVNAAVITDESWPSINPFTGVSIGWHPGNIKFNGSIDALGIWNRALSDAEVAALYNSGTGLELN